MKVLWISNILFGPLGEMVGQSKSLGGSWLDAAFDALQKVDNLELTIVTVSRVKEIIKKTDGKHTFYILPGGYPSQYDSSSIKNKKNWERIKTECRPDLIQIWGTEYTHGYLALQVMQDIPSIIYMQGLMGQIARHILAGISDNELIRSITIRDILKLDWIKRQQLKYYQRSIIETKMIQMSGNVIVENEWCESNCKAIESNCKTFKSKLSIKQEFYGYEWKADQMKPYTIMCNSAITQIKGVHMILKAMSIVIKKYPETQLLITGDKSRFENTLLRKWLINGYTKYLKSIIKEHDLKSRIIFLGELTSSQLAEQMANSNVFVMSSSIENHSSILMEAMIVGMPCISSYVGGIPEYLQHNANGLLYRFEDYEILASHIIKIFDDIIFASKMALNGRISMRNSRNANNIKEELLGIYNNVLNT